HKIWKTDKNRPLDKAATYLRRQQCPNGAWELFYGDGGDLSTTVEAYMGLRLLGIPVNDPALEKAREFILAQGGISKTRIFTKMHLALIGCYARAFIVASSIDSCDRSYSSDIARLLCLPVGS
ncbi:MAG: hypothetical protein ACKPGT_24610, partial [Microcystis sp.]